MIFTDVIKTIYPYADKVQEVNVLNPIVNNYSNRCCGVHILYNCIFIHAHLCSTNGGTLLLFETNLNLN